MSTMKNAVILATAVLSGGVVVVSAQPILDQPEQLVIDAAHAESSASLSDPHQSSPAPPADQQEGYRRASTIGEGETMLDNKVELCRRHLATVEASAAAAADESFGETGRTLSLLGGALRGKPSATADTSSTAAKKPLPLDRRMLSEYGRQLEEANSRRADRAGMEEKRKLNSQRSLFEVLYDFPECRCLNVEDCMSFIQQEHYNNNAGQAPEFEARLIRNYDQNNYNVVAIRPCDDGIHACGADGDGVVTYPFAWVVDGIGYSIGPWNCKNTGLHLTVDECCDFVKSSVPLKDDRGRNIKCHVTPDSRLHPEADPNKVILPYDPKTHSVAGVPYTN